ncbi:hypothetical protein BC828DRAFT_407158 [Blastocladiella britannica]|nr:hypothetical protein BC828DRAFT_407158 [Blastocladiella britannica]
MHARTLAHHMSLYPPERQSMAYEAIHAKHLYRTAVTQKTSHLIAAFDDVATRVVIDGIYLPFRTSKFQYRRPTPLPMGDVVRQCQEASHKVPVNQKVLAKVVRRVVREKWSTEMGVHAIIGATPWLQSWLETCVPIPQVRWFFEMMDHYLAVYLDSVDFDIVECKRFSLLRAPFSTQPRGDSANKRLELQGDPKLMLGPLETQHAMVVARRALAPGTTVRKLVGVKVKLTRDDKADMFNAGPTAYMSLIRDFDNECLLAGPIRFCNHDCDANAKFEKFKGNVACVAVRHIRVGEEITVNYRKEYFPDGECLCSSCESRAEGAFDPLLQQQQQRRAPPSQSLNETNNGNAPRVLGTRKRRREQADSIRNTRGSPQPPPPVRDTVAHKRRKRDAALPIGKWLIQASMVATTRGNTWPPHFAPSDSGDDDDDDQPDDDDDDGEPIVPAPISESSFTGPTSTRGQVPTRLHSVVDHLVHMHHVVEVAASCVAASRVRMLARPLTCFECKCPAYGYHATAEGTIACLKCVRNWVLFGYPWPERGGAVAGAEGQQLEDMDIGGPEEPLNSRRQGRSITQSSSSRTKGGIDVTELLNFVDRRQRSPTTGGGSEYRLHRLMARLCPSSAEQTAFRGITLPGGGGGSRYTAAH